MTGDYWNQEMMRRMMVPCLPDVSACIECSGRGYVERAGVVGGYAITIALACKRCDKNRHVFVTPDEP